MQKKNRLVEIVRSFSYKLNAGNYESRDFFASQKAECLEHEADEVSAKLYAFVKAQVMASVREFREEQAETPTPAIPPRVRPVKAS